jgi:hypothetical protein
MKDQKPVLIPASVPWAVATSAPHLKMRQNAEGKPSDITFIGYFKLNDTAQATTNLGIEIVEDPGTFHPDTHAEDAPYRLIRVSFDGGFAYRRCHAISEYDVISEASYDWHMVPAMILPGEDVRQNLQRSERYWVETGIAPDPLFYEVAGSLWIADLGINDPELRHYIVVGQDEYFDIAARAWRWEAGQSA